jgi:hypothetical protein
MYGGDDREREKETTHNAHNTPNRERDSDHTTHNTHNTQHNHHPHITQHALLHTRTLTHKAALHKHKSHSRQTANLKLDRALSMQTVRVKDLRRSIMLGISQVPFLFLNHLITRYSFILKCPKVILNLIHSDDNRLVKFS